MAPILQVKDLTKRYGGLTAVNEVSFDVEPNEILSVIGPNGAGKSTIFKLISSFVKPSRGEVTFNGEVISGLAPHTVARKGVVRTFQETASSSPTTCARMRASSASILGRRPRVAMKLNSADRATRFSTFSASERSSMRSRATFRRAICGRSASR